MAAYGPALSGLGQGLAAFLGLTLLVAGLAKLVAVDLTTRSLGRLAGSGRRPPPALLAVLALLLGWTEAGLGVLLLILPPSAALGAAVSALCAGFVVAVARARRLGAACGCFGSFSVRAAGPVESARALALLALSLLVLVLGAARRAAESPLWALAAGLACGALVTFTAMAAAAPAGRWHRLRETVRALGGTGWRPAFGWRRRRLLGAVRSDPDVQDVCRRLPARLSWRRAQVRVQGRPVRIATVVVPGPAARLHVVVPAGGRVAVVGVMPGKVLTPRPHRDRLASEPVRDR